MSSGSPLIAQFCAAALTIAVTLSANSAQTNPPIFALYFGAWSERLVKQVAGLDGTGQAYNMVIIDAGRNSTLYITPKQIKNLKSAGTSVICRLSVGLDPILHSSRLSEGFDGPVKGTASWYYDADGDGIIDKDERTSSYYVRLGDKYWKKALKSFSNRWEEGFFGYDYLINTLGCDGLFLDNIDAVMPARWGGSHENEMANMINIIATIRRDIPEGKKIILNGGLFIWYQSEAGPESGFAQLLAPLIDGVVINGYIDESPHQAHAALESAAKTYGFQILTINYIRTATTRHTAQIKQICRLTLIEKNWQAYITHPPLGRELNHYVRDYCLLSL